MQRWRSRNSEGQNSWLLLAPPDSSWLLLAPPACPGSSWLFLTPPEATTALPQGIRNTKPRYRSRKSRKTQGTDQQEWGDLYLGFSLISLICTLVLSVLSQKRPRSNPIWFQRLLKHKTKVQIKRIKENPRYRSAGMG